MFAVIKSGGRQYKVSVGQTLEVNRLAVEDGAQVLFDEVLLISDAERAMVGTPFVANASVVATAVKQARGEKLIVFRYKPKKRIRHRKGHRQELTLLSIDDIVADGKSLITGEAPQARVVAQDEGVATSADADTFAPVDETSETETRTRRRRTSSDEGTESNTEV
jgi:large subunit ribosomal protein L21